MHTRQDGVENRDKINLPLFRLWRGACPFERIFNILHIMLEEPTLLKENLCIYKCFIDVLYIFDRVFKKNWEMRPI